MAGTISYPGNYTSCGVIIRATSGGTVFSADLHSDATLDYFEDTAVVDDAIYFTTTNYYTPFANLKFNVGTADFGAGDIKTTGNVEGTGTANVLVIPTSDPSVAGAIWNDAGTLKVRAG